MDNGRRIGVEDLTQEIVIQRMAAQVLAAHPAERPDLTKRSVKHMAYREFKRAANKEPIHIDAPAAAVRRIIEAEEEN